MAGAVSNAWKAAERRIAAWFGTTRKPGSGSWGRADETTSDTKHERLYIEAKLRAKHGVRSLWDDAKEKAKRENKIPVLALADGGRPGFLVVVHCDHFDEVAAILASRATGGEG